MDWGIYGVNLMCGVFFATGLVVFCRHQRLPWLALAVSVPYMLIVVAMGYSRQGVALGIAMLGLTALGRGSTLWFILWVVFAATFHKSAVFLHPGRCAGVRKEPTMDDNLGRADGLLGLYPSDRERSGRDIHELY